MDSKTTGLVPGGSGTSKLSMMFLDLGSKIGIQNIPRQEVLTESSWWTGNAAIIVAGIASLVATVLACL
jgi:hypothetical protein